MQERFETELQALAVDHLSPSSALAARAAQLVLEIAAESPEHIEDAARRLVQAQPAMAALVCVANVALRALEALGVGSIAPALQALQAGVHADRRAAAAALCERIDAPVVVVTTSASANVVEALQALRRHELLDGIVCGESRPLLEGSALARWLVAQGYDVTLVADAALGEHLRPGRVFLAGADAILTNAVANKRGTRLYATWARLAGVERYVLATRDKLYPPSLEFAFDNPDRPAAELIHDPPAQLRVENRAFDLTPLEVWSEIWVGAAPLDTALQSGDRAAARALLSRA